VRDEKRVVAKEGGYAMRERSALDAIRDGAMLGLAAVAVGMLALWWMFPF